MIFDLVFSKSLDGMKTLLKNNNITELVMVLLVIMGFVLVLMETVMDSVGLCW